MWYWSILAIGCLQSPTTGEADLLDWIRAAAATNEARLQRGSLRATAIYKSRITDRSAEVSLVWDRDLTFVEYQVEEDFSDQAIGQSDGKKIHAARRVQLLRRGKKRWMYDPDHKHLLQITDERMGNDPLTRLRPDEAWFLHYNSTRRFTDLLNPEIFSPEKFTVTATRDAAGRVTVHRLVNSSNESQELIWDADRGGNLVSCQSNFKEYRERSEFDWIAHESGAWYPKSFRYVRTRPTGEFADSFEFQIHEFNPAPSIAPDRFDPASLKVVPETFVREVSAQGTRAYRFGGGPLKRSIIPFRELIRSAQESGFAAPSRAPQ